MSDDVQAAPKKKGGLKKILIVTVGVVALLGAGIGAGLYAAGAGLAGDHAPKEDPNRPKLVPKPGIDEARLAQAEAALAKGKFERSLYQATYYPITDTFTSNLRDSDGFMQLGLGVSTYYDERVLDSLKRNEMPVRSAVLMTLADQDAFVVSTPEGKKQLQKELKDAINQVLEAREGFGGIDDVYFTSFIIQ